MNAKPKRKRGPRHNRITHSILTDTYKSDIIRYRKDHSDPALYSEYSNIHEIVKDHVIVRKSLTETQLLKSFGMKSLLNTSKQFQYPKLKRETGYSKMGIRQVVSLDTDTIPAKSKWNKKLTDKIITDKGYQEWLKGNI
jgi:hypothetical protein